MPDLLIAMTERGEMTEVELDSAEIRQDLHEKKKHRDVILIFHRRAMIMTHIEVRKKNILTLSWSFRRRHLWSLMRQLHLMLQRSRKFLNPRLIHLLDSHLKSTN